MDRAILYEWLAIHVARTLIFQQMLSLEMSRYIYAPSSSRECIIYNIYRPRDSFPFERRIG